MHHRMRRVGLDLSILGVSSNSNPTKINDHQNFLLRWRSRGDYLLSASPLDDHAESNDGVCDLAAPPLLLTVPIISLPEAGPAKSMTPARAAISRMMSAATCSFERESANTSVYTC